MKTDVSACATPNPVQTRASARRAAQLERDMQFPQMQGVARPPPRRPRHWISSDLHRAVVRCARYPLRPRTAHDASSCGDVSSIPAPRRPWPGVSELTPVSRRLHLTRPGSALAFRESAPLGSPRCPARPWRGGNMSKIRIAGKSPARKTARHTGDAAMSLDTRTDTLEQARHLLDAAEAGLRLDQLADAVGLSPSHLQRRFRARIGMSPAESQSAGKLGRFKQALREGADVTTAVYDAGFGSGSRVYEHTDRLLGMTPARSRAGGADVAVRYTALKAPHGRKLVAATERGVCAVALGANDADLLRELKSELPKAQFERVDEGKDEWLAALIAHVFAQLV